MTEPTPQKLEDYGLTEKKLQEIESFSKFSKKIHNVLIVLGCITGALVGIYLMLSIDTYATENESAVPFIMGGLGLVLGAFVGGSLLGYIGAFIISLISGKIFLEDDVERYKQAQINHEVRASNWQKTEA